MATSLANASLRERDGAAVIDLQGEINRTAEAALNGAFESALQRGPSTVVLNFERVTYINSTGIALIVGVLARARKDGVAVTACGLSNHYKEIFQITRLADFMPMFADENAALSESPK